MILTDGTHLVSDRSIEELHRFARNLGLKRCWFQEGGARKIPHFDLTTPNAVSRALENGAVLVTSRDIVRRARRKSPSLKTTKLLDNAILRGFDPL